jgi:SAM-dependent methyltransferase
MCPAVSAYRTEAQLGEMEPFFPLHAFVCESCLLVQLPQAQTPEQLFGDYPYLSSVSKSWLRHAERFAEHAVERFGLTSASRVVEIASNDGYLLRYFMARGIAVHGVEPAANIARMAQESGVPTTCAFFGSATARSLVAEGRTADLVVANNVLAHVPAIRDFVDGVRILLKPGGTASFEFPYLPRTIEGNQFDQVFHEHFSYLSLTAVVRIFGAVGLTIVDAAEWPTHGGSLRIFAVPAERGATPSASVGELLAAEARAGLADPSGYTRFAERARAVKHRLLETLLELKRNGRTIVGYGAPGKGVVLLNYCGLRADVLDYLVDLNPQKQGKFMPGVHLPIHSPDRIRQTRPDYLLVLPWNLRDEILEQMGYIREWGGQFIFPIPEVQIA